MTTQPPTSPTEQIFSGFAVNAIPLYGILVTEKSFLLGKRALALQDHASYLAHRVAGHRLPAELCDQIGSELTVLHTEGAERLWESMEGDPGARSEMFRYGAGTASLTGSEKAAWIIYTKLSKRDVADGTVIVQAVDAHLNLLLRGAERGNNQRYIHLSASLIKPSVSMPVPGVVPTAGGSPMSLANGTAMRTRNQKASAKRPSSDNVTVLPEGSGGAARLIQLDDVEASIHGWNLDLIESFVGLLKLETVIVPGEKGTRGGMEPRLRLLQRLKWGQLNELNVPQLRQM
jgi:hypothetical protein